MDKLEKHKQRTEKFQHVMQMIETSQTYAFRIIALTFLVAVVIALFVAVFLGKDLSAGFLTAITVLTVLPILIIRAFDISVLNLTKEGIMAEMSHKEDNEFSSMNTLPTLNMSESVYETLLSLSGKSPAFFKLDEELKDQLTYLKNIGYIKATNSFSLQDEDKQDLRNHFSVTKNGYVFLNLVSKRSATGLPQDVRA